MLPIFPQLKLNHLIEDNHSDTVPQDQTECFLRWAAEVCSVDGGEDVGVSVDELHELLETPEAAFAETEEDLDGRLVRALLLELLLNVLDQRSDGLYNGYNERAKGEGSCVVPDQKTLYEIKEYLEYKSCKPQCSPEAVENWEGGDIRLVKDPVPWGESSGQHHLSESGDKAEAPEQCEEIVELEIIVEIICSKSWKYLR